VQVAGEQWSATLVPGKRSLKAGERVQVEKVEGVRLIVRHLNDEGQG
jgi:membrane protein implicated in regulation of membrane protease activity